MSYNHHLPKKLDLTPKKHHGFQVVLWLLGMLLPPIAILVRFGVGKDLFINIILTICGYFPGHGHNFYCQNIRNNTNRNRTPKWVRKAGLVDPRDEERAKAKSTWAKRYNERNNESAHVGQALEEGEEGTNYIPEDPREAARRERMRNEGLWTNEDEEWYNEERREAPNQHHWHYPANFEGTDAANPPEDRWSRSKNGRQSSTGGGERDEITGAIIGGSSGNANGGGGGYRGDDDVPVWGQDYGSGRKKSKNPLKKKKSQGNVNDWSADGPMAGGMNGGGAGGGYGYGDVVSGGGGRQAAAGGANGQAKKKSSDPFDHEF